MVIRALFVVWVFLFSSSFPQGRVDGVAAVVGNNIILHGDVLQQTQFLAIEEGVDPTKNPYLFEQLYISSLNNIVDQYAVLGVAEKDTNLVISNDEINRALDQQIENFIIRAGSEEHFLDMAGMTMRQIRSDYWNDIRDMMLVERYQFSKIQNVDVGRIEIERFFDLYKDSIPPVPEQYGFSVIEVPFVAGENSEKTTFLFLESLKNNIITNNLDFDSLAKKLSQDPGTSSSGGYLGFTTRGTLVREYEEAAYSLSPGDISYPIRSPFGYHLVRLVDKQGEKISTQHILRTVDFSDEDKINTFSTINGLRSFIDNNPVLFDSLANIYSNKYNNFSGIYSGNPPINTPEVVLSMLSDHRGLELSLPVETRGGYIMIFYYSHQNEIVPDLDNSWNLIYQYAKQNKQNNVLNGLVNNIKKNTYINFLYN